MTSLRLIKTVVSLAFLIGILLVLLATYRGGSDTNFLLLVGFVVAAWIVVFYFVIWPDDNAYSARKLLSSFTYHVDLARQQHGTDTRILEQQVLKAFEKLHNDTEALLQKRLIRIAQLKREVMRFHIPPSPHAAKSTRWRPPTLSEMGYVLAAADKYTRGEPVLALYKFSGEARSGAGQVADTYTILKEGRLSDFSGNFEAKVQSPFPIALDAPPVARDASGDEVPMSRIDTPLDALADSEHNVAYILSLLGPVTTLNNAVLNDNLRAMSALAPDPAHARVLSAASVRSWQRSALTERIGYLKSSLPLARRALQQEPQLMVGALADIYRNGDDDAAALSFCLATIADMLAPLSAQPRHDIEYWLSEFTRLTQNMTVATGAPLENPGIAYIDARGTEADAALLRRAAELTSTAAKDAGERGIRVHLFSDLTDQAFRRQLRGFRELNAGAEDQAVIHALLQHLNEDKLSLHQVDGNETLKAKAFPRPAGHQPGNELYYAVNPAGIELEGAAPQARYVLWTLSGRALHAPAAEAQPLIEIARKLRCCAVNGSNESASPAEARAQTNPSPHVAAL